MSPVVFVFTAFLLLKVTPLTCAISHGRYRSRYTHVAGNEAPAAGYATGHVIQTEEHQPLPEGYVAYEAGYEAKIAGYATSTGFNNHKHGAKALERGPQTAEYEGQAVKYGGQLEHLREHEEEEKEVMKEENEMRMRENEVLTDQPEYAAEYGAHHAGYGAQAEEQHREVLSGRFAHPEYKAVGYGAPAAQVRERQNEVATAGFKHPGLEVQAAQVREEEKEVPAYLSKWRIQVASNRAKAARYGKPTQVREQHRESVAAGLKEPERVTEGETQEIDDRAEATGRNNYVDGYGTHTAEFRAHPTGANALRASYGELNKMNERILAVASKKLEFRARAAGYGQKQKLQGELEELLAAQTMQHGHPGPYAANVHPR